LAHLGGVACHGGQTGPSKPPLIVEGGEPENMVADIKAVTVGHPASS
jgi:hypothetical protein